MAGCLPREVEASRLGRASVSSSATTATRVALRLGRAVVRWGSNGELKRGGACSVHITAYRMAKATCHCESHVCTSEPGGSFLPKRQT